ncbi:sensor histidine kinase [Streptomyces sp. NPDC050418]|uniref:sensor histidine kinase n=1 Tax=Streptomyces sp. NPDC050418 TaxID=3365612 RepID=UPI00378CE8BB
MNVLERYRRWRRRVWDERSHVERMEFQSLSIVRAMAWFFYLSWLVLPLVALYDEPPLVVTLAVLLLCSGADQCVVASRLLPQAFDAYLGRGAVSKRLRLYAGALMIATLALGIAVQKTASDTRPSLTVFFSLFAVIPYCLERCLTLPVRTYNVRALLGAAVVMGAAAATGLRGGTLIAVALGVYGGALLCLASVRCSAWSLGVMWQAEQGREAQARLAVAEERLRFGRDLHDVMGRNLAVIALKSELAVQLAHRGRPEAVDQMIEVQRIAQESQREIQEVVRGYREASLGSELAGAQAVLSAAGIDCTVSGADAAETLPTPAHAALGWVVREAATNVLRHGDASRCAITLAVADGRAVLTVENDGAGAESAGGTGDASPGGPGPGGSGLAGLRERLAVLGGRLTAGPAGDGMFRLVAQVPLRVPTKEVRRNDEGPRTSENEVAR